VDTDLRRHDGAAGEQLANDSVIPPRILALTVLF
jgi:hypothetical protein